MNEEILRNTRRLADEVFRPRAQETDQGGPNGAIRDNIRMLADAGYYGLGISQEYGGFGADDPTRREYTELVASACGVTAFTQQQLHSGGGFVGGAADPDLKRRLLPRFASGELLCGVAFSHLRRRGAPMVTATKTGGGYIVEGKAPWVTAWGLLDAFALGATVSDTGEQLYAYIAKADHAGEISASSPMPLAVMAASDTVELTFHRMMVPDEQVLYTRPPDSLRLADFHGITGHAILPLGCARGSVHYLRGLAAERNAPELESVAEAFEREIDSCRTETLTWTGDRAERPDYEEHALRARATAIVIATRAAHAAITATGGTAHLLQNPPQRLIREAVFYTTLAQTPDVKSGTLDLLVSPDYWQEL